MDRWVKESILICAFSGSKVYALRKKQLNNQWNFRIWEMPTICCLPSTLTAVEIWFFKRCMWLNYNIYKAYNVNNYFCIEKEFAKKIKTKIFTKLHKPMHFAAFSPF